MHLAQALLFVSDVRRMQEFYEGVLGFAVVAVEPGFVQLSAGQAMIALHAIPPEYMPEIASPPVEREDGVIKLGFHVDDVDAERTRLIARGVTMRDVKRWSGIAFCDGIDPEGNVFQLTTR